MERLYEYFRNKNLEEALLNQLKELSKHANTAILYLREAKYDNLYCELFIIEAIARSLRMVFDAIASSIEKTRKSK